MARKSDPHGVGGGLQQPGPWVRTTAAARTGAVSGLTNVTAIAAGENHSLALKSDGTVWAWGQNNSGQLGDGTTTPRSLPVLVTGLVDIVGIAGGTGFSLAFKADGSVYAWGNGSLGTGAESSPLPLVVRGADGFGTLNLDLRPATFHPRVNITPGFGLQSNTIVLSGIANGSAISVTDGSTR